MAIIIIIIIIIVVVVILIILINVPESPFLLQDVDASAHRPKDINGPTSPCLRCQCYLSPAGKPCVLTLPPLL